MLTGQVKFGNINELSRQRGKQRKITTKKSWKKLLTKAVTCDILKKLAKSESLKETKGFERARTLKTS